MTTNLKQALGRLKEWGDSPDQLTPQVVVDIFTGLDAAGLVVLLKETCQTCHGEWYHQAVFCPGGGQEGSTCHPCPDCAGRGWNPTAQAIYAAANVLAVNDMQKGPPDMLAEIGPDLAAPYLALAKDQLIEVLSMGDTK